jgi:putative SOS response-associated peptidase YedK
MCGRYTLTRDDQIAADFEAALGDAPRSEWWKPRFNVAPTQPAPVVVVRGGARQVEMMRWGLVPHWAGPGGKRAPLMIYARVESLEAKAIFRDALRRRRCLVPADGFFEWLRDPQARGKAKPRPIYMHPASRRLVGFAGLWAWHREDAVETLSFTILTCPPNELVRPYHDRMPLVLDPAAYAAWLDPALDAAAARALLGTPPVGDWVAEPVSTLVNSVAHDEPACIAPLEPPARVQQTLFD